MRRIILVLAILIVVVLVFGIGRDIIYLLKSKLIKVDCVNVSYYDIFKELKFRAILDAEPVLATFNGTVDYLVENGTYVNKGDLVAVISSEEEKGELRANTEGIFLNYVLSPVNAYGSLQDDFDFYSSSVEQRYGGSKVKEKDFVASIVKDNTYELVFRKEDVTCPVENLRIILDDGITRVKPNSVRESGNCIFLRLSSYLLPIIQRNSISVSLGRVYGLKIEKEEIVERDGKRGVFIVNGDNVLFLPLDIIQIGDYMVGKIDDERFSEFKYFLVVKTPILVKEGQKVGSF